MSGPNTLVAHRGKRVKGYFIDKYILNHGLTKIKEAIEEYGLDTTSPQAPIIGIAKDGTLGTDRAKQSSIERYAIVWRGVLNYCITTKRYESGMLFARDLCPADPVPLDLDTAINYMRMRVLKQGTILRHYRTNNPILDNNGTAIECLGDWRSVSGLSIYRSALSKIHSHYDTTKAVSYVPECNGCRALGVARCQKGESCITCCGKPQFWRRGNVTKDATFKNNFDQLVEYVESEYEARHTFAFLPQELRAVRTYLLSHNTLYHLMIWTIIICGTKLFARIDEALDLTVEQFMTDYFVVSENDVGGLCLKLKGKTDKEWANLAMWDDEQCPDFSATRAILIWLALSGIKSGKIFPSKRELEDKSTAPSQSMDYEEFLGWIKHLCAGPLKKDMESEAMKNLIIGTHILRKTAFLLAFWGFFLRDGKRKLDPMDEANILQSARHKHISSTVTYLSDCGTLKSLLDRVVDKDSTLDMSKNKVGIWEPIRVRTLSAFASLNLPSDKYKRPITELANWYVFEKLGVVSSRINVAEVHNIACTYVPSAARKSELHELLEQNLDTETLAKVLKLIHISQQEHIQAAVTTAGGTNGIVQALPEEDAMPKPRARKQQKPNTDETVQCERDYQSETKKEKSVEGKIRIYFEAVEEIKQQVRDGKALVSPLKEFAHRADKCLDCVKNCHGGRVDAFITSNPGYTHSRFSTCSNNKKHSGCFDVDKIGYYK